MPDGVAARLREEREGLIRLPGGRQGQPQVDADPLVVGCELRGRSEQPFGVGPPPLEVIAVARVVPDPRVFRAELEGFLVVNLGLGKPSQPIEGAPDAPMGQGFVRRLERPALRGLEDREGILILEHRRIEVSLRLEDPSEVDMHLESLAVGGRLVEVGL